MAAEVCRMDLKDFLNDEQIHHVLRQVLNREEIKEFQDISGEVTPMAGVSGFLGDHFKAVIKVKGDQEYKIKLFIKKVPSNKRKADFINEFKFFERELFVLKLFKEIGECDVSHPYCTKAVYSNESMIVMPDLSAQGYTLFPKVKTFDLPHALVAAVSLARFHAACANYETKISEKTGSPYKVPDDFGSVFFEYINIYIYNTPWLNTAAKVSANLLNVFSKYNKPEFVDKLDGLFSKGCEILGEYTLNVLVHLDLWVNNIMFRYNMGVPVNAVLIDFQCVRYAPPVFDVITLLYLTTNRSFRDHHETDFLRFYFSTFMEKIDASTKQRLKDLKYEEDEFLKWCEKCRMFALIQAMAQLPGVLMDDKEAKKNFEDPEGYERFIEDPSEAVLSHCRDSAVYRYRQLQVAEEFVERYLLVENRDPESQKYRNSEPNKRVLNTGFKLTRAFFGIFEKLKLNNN